MADAATVNALKDISKQIQEQNRILKKLSDVAEALNQNVVVIARYSMTKDDTLDQQFEAAIERGVSRG